MTNRELIVKGICDYFENTPEPRSLPEKIEIKIEFVSGREKHEIHIRREDGETLFDGERVSGSSSMLPAELKCDGCSRRESFDRCKFPTLGACLECGCRECEVCHEMVKADTVQLVERAMKRELPIELRRFVVGDVDALPSDIEKYDEEMLRRVWCVRILLSKRGELDISSDKAVLRCFCTAFSGFSPASFRSYLRGVEAMISNSGLKIRKIKYCEETK